MRFPGVPFPMLGNPSLAGIVPIKQVAPHNVREGEWMELLEPLCWGQGRNRSGTLELSGRVGTGYLSFILASLLLLPGSLRPVQVTVFGFIFCWARLSPGRGGKGRWGHSAGPGQRAKGPQWVGRGLSASRNPGS